MECKECLERISEYIDEELYNSVHTEIKTHLLSCQNCRKVAMEFKMLHERVQQSLENIPVPIDLEKRILIAVERERQKVSKQRVVTLFCLVFLGSLFLLMLLFLLRILHLIYAMGYAFWRIKAVLLMMLPNTTSWGIGVTAFFLGVFGIYVIRSLLRGSRLKEVSL